MLLAPVTLQAARDRLLVRLHAPVAQPGQNRAVALARYPFPKDMIRIIEKRGALQVVFKDDVEFRSAHFVFLWVDDDSNKGRCSFPLGTITVVGPPRWRALRPDIGEAERD